MKFCRKCSKDLPTSCFNMRMKRGKRVMRSQCRKCEAEYSKAWQKKNHKKWLEHKAKIRNEKRDIYRFYAKRARYIARSPNPHGRHSMADWESMKMKYGYMCLCCKKIEPEIRLTPDHIIPTSKGGSDSIENIQPLCVKCNQIKNNKIIQYV